MRDIIREEFRKVLLESKISKRESTSRKILRRNSLEKNGKEMTKEESDLELHNIKRLIPNSSNSKSLECLYLPSVTRMYCKGEFKNSDISQKVNSIIGYLCKNNIVEDLEKITAQGLIDKYDEVVQNINKADNDKAKKEAESNVANKGYTIKKIISFEDSKQYSKYVDWCVTLDEYHFNKYTEGGKLPFFFCLKDDYDKIQRPQEKTGNPKDEYGLSMIAVVFYSNGNIRTSTTRWNHDNGGNDNMFTMTELVKVVGGDILKYGEEIKEYFEEKEKIFYNKIKKLFKKGNSLDDIFDDVKEFDNINICELDDKYYILNKKNEFIYEKSFRHIDDFNEGFGVILENDKENYINTNGELLLSEWFDYCWRFKNGFGKILLNDKYNYVNANGKFLMDQWVDRCYKFSDGVAKIVNNGKCNFINTNGDLISNIWFDKSYPFHDGFGYVLIDKKYYYIDKNGKLYTPSKKPVQENKSIDLMKRMMLL